MSVNFTITPIKYTGYTATRLADIFGFDKSTNVANLTQSVVTNSGTNYTIVNIGNDAFEQCSLLSVDFGGMGELTNIGFQAFYFNINLTALNQFTKATKLQSIGDYAFRDCSLLSVDFGGMAQLTNIGGEAFRNNPNLTELNFGGLSQTNLSIDANAFEFCNSLRQVYYQNSTLLNNSLTNISGGQKHMYIERNPTNNTILSIDFQDAQNLLSINTNEFIGQSQLTALNQFISATKLQNIGNGAFFQCSLLSVDFGGMGELTNIGLQAFYENINLTALNQFISATKLQNIGDYAFYQCSLLSVDFGGMGELTNIGEGAFYYNRNLTALNQFISATKLQNIGNGAFFQCSLLSVDFGGMGELTNIGVEAFYYNRNLTSLNFGGLSQPNLSIASNAFDECTSLRQVYYQNSNLLNNSLANNISGGQKHMYIQRNATNNTILSIDFQDAPNLLSINTDEFKSQSQLYALNNFNYATKLTSINTTAFYQCTSIQSIFFPSSLTAINANSFNGNSSLQSVTFGSPSPLTIVASAFTNCTRLSNIYHYDTNISQLTQLTSLSTNGGRLYNLSQDLVTLSNYSTKLAITFLTNYDITSEQQKSEIKNNYAANIIQVALNGGIFNPNNPIEVQLGAIPFLVDQLNLPNTTPLRLYPNYTTPTNPYTISSSNTDVVYFQMNIGSVLYLSNGQTITKNANNTYTYSGNNAIIYQPGNEITIDGKTITFGGVTISGGGGGGDSGGGSELGGGFSGLSPKPIILVERGNERGANRQILRRASFFNMNTYTQSNPGYNVNYIIDSGIPVKNKVMLNKDSSERTRRLKLKSQNKTYNDSSFGGNDSNGSYTALSRVRH